MTQQEEIDCVHKVLAHVLRQNGALIYIFDDPVLALEGDEAEAVLDRLHHEGLIKPTDRTAHGALILTTKGRDIARAPGGYKGMLQARQDELREQQVQARQQRQAQAEQQEQQREQLQLTRTSTEAAVRSANAADQSVTASHTSATWAKRGGWIALASVLATCYFAWRAEQAKDATDLRVAQLEQQLAALQQQQPPSPRTPASASADTLPKPPAPKSEKSQPSSPDTARSSGRP